MFHFCTVFFEFWIKNSHVSPSDRGDDPDADLSPLDFRIGKLPPIMSPSHWNQRNLSLGDAESGPRWEKSRSKRPACAELSPASKSTNKNYQFIISIIISYHQCSEFWLPNLLVSICLRVYLWHLWAFHGHFMGINDCAWPVPGVFFLPQIALRWALGQLDPESAAVSDPIWQCESPSLMIYPLVI